MRFVIVTGMSGAGKSSTLKMLEDAGYFCVDNLPVPLISKFAKLLFQEHGQYDKVAIGEISAAARIWRNWSRFWSR